MHFCVRCGAATQIPERKRASGRAPSAVGHCRACLDARTAAQVGRNAARSAKGQCARCSIALVNFNFLECARCRSKSRRWWALRQGKASVPEVLPHRPTNKRPPSQGRRLETAADQRRRRHASFRARRQAAGRPPRAVMLEMWQAVQTDGTPAHVVRGLLPSWRRRRANGGLGRSPSAPRRSALGGRLAQLGMGRANVP